MRLAFIDKDGTQFSAVYRIQQEGHDVAYWIDCDEPGEKGDVYRKIGDGLVPKVHSIDQIRKLKPDVVVVYNDVDAHDAAEKAGLTVWGSSKASTELEADRMVASEIAVKYGVGIVPRMYRFTSADEAMGVLEHDPCERWVFKAEGTDVPTSSTHVCDSKEHLAEVMHYETGRGAREFVVQEHVQGVEVSIEGWYDYRLRGGWLRPFNSTLERKRMFAGDVGPMSGAMGSVVWAWMGERPRLFQETLEGLSPYLKAIQYLGPLDGNFIVNEDGPHFLEFTPRLGWDAFEAEMSGFTSSIGEFFVRLGQGKTNTFPITTREFMVAVRTYIATAPDVPVLLPIDDEHFYLKDLYVHHGRDGEAAPRRDERHDGRAVGMEHARQAQGRRGTGAGQSGRLLTTGTNTDNSFTVIAEVGNTGETIRAATDPIYERYIPQIQAPDVTYRTDMGVQAQLDLDRLESWGYETPGSEVQPWNAGRTAMTGRRRM